MLQVSLPVPADETTFTARSPQCLAPGRLQKILVGCMDGQTGWMGGWMTEWINDGCMDMDGRTERWGGAGWLVDAGCWIDG